MLFPRLWTATAPFIARCWNRMPNTLRWQVVWRVVPKFVVGVCGVCLNDEGRILLLRHRFRRNGVEWGLPGGWLARGELPDLALQRELLEETGLPAEIVAPLQVDGNGAWVEIIYLCRVPTRPPTLQTTEIIDARWCDPAADLPRMRRSQYLAVRQVAARLATANTTPVC
jgi:8-oxo-dGTP diphosphatase